jgi:protein-L-isoaspartate(D-aspartate) O-methyltransferase
VYQSTVLAAMGAWVFTIERQKKLFEENKNFYFKNKYPNIKFFYGDGFEGLSTFGPFDKIIITAAAPFIPPKLLQQLKVGGMMVIPVDEGDAQRMLRITKMQDGTFNEESFDLFSFVPMLKGKNS